ncbi:glycosyltransferase family 4 protein [Sphingosinicella sp. BN140058]|uniref:glycosyltransferase family 4 protein n=1 Tax=Sphingosinicella sp. BN140058 TaxID=1892855 RepID=UPI001010AF7A|nr:glycosyltransferase family 4 protein [Sphingosinicella sp. BN140058]QAY78041.1 glycosyltransferase family 1 protein [Sphingosinicella sp. BN140058]
MKIVVLASLAMSLVRFRGKLLEELVKAGHEVVACAPDVDAEVIRALEQMGARYRQTPMARAGLNPLRDLATLARYAWLCVDEKPDAIIAYTQKPIIYGGLVARLRAVRFHVVMSGLGYVYSEAADRRVWLRKLVSRLYRAGVARAETIFVFNDDDRRMMLEHGIIDPQHRVLQVPGSGVDTGHYTMARLPEGPPCFLMMARLMRDKGVGDYIEAARRLRPSLPDARFMLLGRPETENPTGYSHEDVQAWAREGLIEHIPETRDVRPYLAQCHAFVLPSFYREGLPRTILEAMSSGRPVITCDLPGCRDAITDGVTGFLVPARSPETLAAAMLRIVEDRKRLEQMAAAAREAATARYDVRKVNALLIRAMGLHTVGRGRSHLRDQVPAEVEA